MQPLIGIVAHTDLNRYHMPVTSIALTYTSAIESAGGVPVILPYTANHSILSAMTDSIRGFLLPGGKDIDPALYQEMPVEQLGEVDRALDLYQIEVLDLAMVHAKPVLGICRGAQVVNVALGGSLFQDIPSQFETPPLKHLQAEMDTDHPIDIVPGSRLHALFGAHIVVNSRHHQSIKKPAHDLSVTARSSDGVIEAAQHNHLPIDLVQWHPERMLQESLDMLPLFEAFVEKCRRWPA
ncbi:MAG: gamma-glutamyl-gamma-aminobutyrate hydrolase family protein [Desulfosarcina sp.]